MVIRTILVALSGGKASEGAAETACRLAVKFDAHLEALHVRADPREILPDLGMDIAVPVATELIDRDAGERGKCNKSKAIFERPSRATPFRHTINLLA